ncbi:uncharacterized protein TRIADDRAFT_57370 [Trichoplax adhaerens]|uniref:Cadherin domain-containing protein n=1 Tax=Trichoplax adhaerens TaxID=10228 RepID=B3RZ92_TRIAD|nr:predicted protein [Trichoplax adhaerens]EDV24163.1 predicted protein [Trichoplax adhaerens]|eukprot:XP_002113689.1 predicted protein [Trichoplax adhaerens]
MSLAEYTDEISQMNEGMAPEFTSEAYVLTYSKYLKSNSEAIVEPNLIVKYKGLNQQRDGGLEVQILDGGNIPFKIMPTDEVYAIDDVDNSYSYAREFKVVSTRSITCDNDGVYIFHAIALHSTTPNQTSKRITVQVNVLLNEDSFPKMVNRSLTVVARKGRSNLDILKIPAEPKSCGSDICIISNYAIADKAFRNLFQVSNQGYLSIIGKLSERIGKYSFEVVAYDCRGVSTINTKTVITVINQFATVPSIKFARTETIFNPCQSPTTIGNIRATNLKNQNIHSVNITVDLSVDKRGVEACYRAAHSQIFEYHRCVGKKFFYDLFDDSRLPAWSKGNILKIPNSISNAYRAAYTMDQKSVIAVPKGIIQDGIGTDNYTFASRIKLNSSKRMQILVTLNQSPTSDTFIKLKIVDSRFQLDLGESKTKAKITTIYFPNFIVQSNLWYQILLVTNVKSRYTKMMVNGETLHSMYAYINRHYDKVDTPFAVTIGHMDARQSFQGIIADVSIAFNIFPKFKMDYCVPQCKEGIYIKLNHEDRSRLSFLHPDRHIFTYPAINNNNDLAAIVQGITYYNQFSHPEFGNRIVDIRIGINHNRDIISIKHVIRIAKSLALEPNITITGNDHLIMRMDDKNIALMKYSRINYHHICKRSHLDKAIIQLLHRNHRCAFIKIDKVLATNVGLTVLEDKGNIILSGVASVSTYQQILNTLYYYNYCPPSVTENIVTAQVYSNSQRFASNLKYYFIHKNSGGKEGSDNLTDSEDKVHWFSIKNKDLWESIYPPVIVLILSSLIIFIIILIANRYNKGKNEIKMTTPVHKGKLSNLKLTYNRLETYKFD